MSYPTFLMSQLLLDSTTLFDECAYDDGDCKLHQQRPQRGIKTLVKSNNAEEDIT